MKLKFKEVISIINQIANMVSGDRAVHLLSIATNEEFIKIQKDISSKMNELNEKHIKELEGKTQENVKSIEIKHSEERVKLGSEIEYHIKDKELEKSIVLFSKAFYDDVVSAKLQIGLNDLETFTNLMK